MRSNSRKANADSRKAIVALLLVVVFGFSGAAMAQQHSFDEVASGLKHPDAQTRLRAIQILKDADYPEAAVPIAAVLGDADDRVQLAAIDAERSLFTSRAVPRKKKIGFVIEVRTVAGGESAAAGQLTLKPRAIPPQVLAGLAGALRDRTPGVRSEAMNLAGLLGSVACAPKARSQPDVPAVDDACTQIGNALVDNINSREAQLRRGAMQAIGQIRYANAVQALSDQFSYYQQGPDATAALEGLAGIGHPMSVSIFEDLLNHSNAGLRRLAVEGLARSGQREVLPRLQQLGQSDRAAEVLLALHYANVRLGNMENSLQTLLASLATPSQRPVALRYVLDLSTSHAPQLAGALKDPSVDVRRLAADAIGFSRNPAVIPALEAAAKDSDPDVAAAARNAIARLKL
jgi:HEAT repeat protein